MILLLGGCLTMDGFFFNGTPTDAYTLGYDTIPEVDVEEVAFDGADGSTLYGVWARQENPNAQLYLYFHGNEANIDAYWSKVEFYWSMGYTVFIFDYRGFGKSEGSPTYDTVMEDGRSAVDYVDSEFGRGVDHIVYHGLSLGGSVAVHTAVERPPKVLITEAMFASAKKLINDGSGMDLPEGWFVEDAWDNIAAAREVYRPYLIIHGAADDFIQPSHAEAVYEFANDPKKLWLVPGAGHADSDEVAPEDYADHISCWVDQSCVE